jgi:hypothetical protein
MQTGGVQGVQEFKEEEPGSRIQELGGSGLRTTLRARSFLSK